MVTHPPHIDGSDWDISDEPITYPDRDVADACRRALQWCREQAPHLRADFAFDADERYSAPTGCDNCHGVVFLGWRQYPRPSTENREPNFEMVVLGMAPRRLN